MQNDCVRYRRRSWWVRSVFVLLLGAAAAGAARPDRPSALAGQTAPNTQVAVGTALILGQVVDAAGGPVANAMVTLSGGLVQSGSFATQVSAAVIPGGPRRALTNADGRFLFSDLPKGAYSIDVAKSGYVAGAYGKHRPDGLAQSIVLADDERNGTIKIEVWKLASISGALTDDAGEPFVGATIWSLRRSFATGRSQFTENSSAVSDDRGYFRLSSLMPGEYVICVVAAQSTLPASLVDQYAQAMQSGTTADMMRQLNYSSVGFSAPVSQPGIRMGDSVLYIAGMYSRGMVPPSPDETGRVLSFQTTFSPGVTTLVEAQVITLRSGEERMAADIKLRLVPTAPVSGVVTGPNGPAANMGIRLAPEFAAELGNEQIFEPALTITDAGGRFRFLGVPVGNYTLRALRVPAQQAQPVLVSPMAPGGFPPPPPVPPPIPQEPTLWANLPITVEAEGLANLDVRLRTGFRISGRLVFDGTTTKPTAAQIQGIRLAIQPADGHHIGYSGTLRGRIDADGTITSFEVPPGKYMLRLVTDIGGWAAMPGWLFRSAVVSGVDVSGTPLDLQRDVTDLIVTISDHSPELSGIVRNESGAPDPSAMVIVFSATASDWSNFGESARRIRNMRPGLDGRYRATGLAPGPYYVVAIPDAQAVEWQDPRVLQSLTRIATRVTLADSEKTNQDVVTRAVK